MAPFPNHLAPLVRRRLERYLKQNPQVIITLSLPRAVQAITQIIDQNVTSGRCARFCKEYKGTRRLTPTRYTDTVIAHWLAEAAHWANLQNRDRQTWNDLAEWLTRQAKKWFGEKRSLRGHTAEDFAAQTIARMLQADYPFDVPFAPWALTILHREIWGTARRRKDVLDHDPDSLDDWRTGDSESNGVKLQVTDPLAEIFPKLLQEREVLWNAMNRLSEPLFDVINLSFFGGLTDEEIARKVNTTTANIQTRCHRALARLHFLLTGIQMSGKRRRRH